MSFQWLLGLALHLMIVPSPNSNPQIQCQISLRAGGGFLDINFVTNVPEENGSTNYRGERLVQTKGRDVTIQVSGVLWPGQLAIELVDQQDGREDLAVGAVRVIPVSNPGAMEVFPFSMPDGETIDFDFAAPSEMTTEVGEAFSYLANALGTYLEADSMKYFMAGLIPMMTRQDFLHLDIQRLIGEQTQLLFSEEIDSDSFVDRIVYGNQRVFEDIKKRIAFDDMRLIHYIDADHRRNFLLLLFFEKAEYVFIYRFEAFRP